MDKRATVVESIQKLLNLGVSDKEIADNLYDVGIEQSDAMNLIREARQALMGVKPADTSSSGSQVSIKPVSDSLSLSMDEEIVSQIPLGKKPLQSRTEKENVQDKVVDEVKGNEKQKSISEESDFDEDKAEALTEEDGSDEDSEDFLGNESESASKSSAKTSSSGGANESSPFDSDLLALEKKFSKPKEAVAQQAPQVQKKPLAQTTSSTSAASSTGASSSAVGASPVQSSQKKAVLLQSDFSSKQTFKVPKQSPKQVPSGEEDFDELWKKGIVVAVNTKLAEMKRLKDDIDVEILQKVEESMRKELYQYKVLVDSQKELITSSNKEALDQKQKEIVFIIDAKIAELRQYNKQLSDNLASIESSKRSQQDALAQISAALEDAKRTKTQLVVEMNSELIKSKSSAQAFLDSASMHLSQMDERINKALELEKNIAEGMLAQAEQRIEQLAISRADELIGELQVELNKLQTASKVISPEAIEQKIVILDEFKRQFLTSMQDSLNQINVAIEELNEKNAIAERTLQEKSLAIDAKLEELTKFEKELTDRLDKSMKKK